MQQGLRKNESALRNHWFLKRNIEKFSYLHQHITANKEIPNPDDKSLKGFLKPLENTVSSNKIHSSEEKRRGSLLKHLESIASKFEGSKLSPFGSLEERVYR